MQRFITWTLESIWLRRRTRGASSNEPRNSATRGPGSTTRSCSTPTCSSRWGLPRGQRRKIRFLNPEVGAVNVNDPIALYISAMGPRSRALTAALGANWMQVAGYQRAATAAVAEMDAAWRSVGVDPASRVAAALASG